MLMIGNSGLGFFISKNEIESSEKLSVNESEGHILKPPSSNQLDCSQGTKERQILHLLKTWETDHLASCQVLLYHFFPPFLLPLEILQSGDSQLFFTFFFPIRK